MTEGIVLEDSLFCEYHKFTSQKKDFDKDKVKRILHFYKRQICTNIAQYNRTGIDLPASLQYVLIHSCDKNKTLEELAKASTYKIILSDSCSVYPRVNILGDEEKIENNLSATFMRGESRDKARSHIRDLCSKAKDILVFDRYINKDAALNMLKFIFPVHALNIHYISGQIDGTAISELKKKCSSWNFMIESDVITENHHDRYLLVDNKIEIILSSGFDHLASDISDFTYVVREIRKCDL